MVLLTGMMRHKSALHRRHVELSCFGALQIYMLLLHNKVPRAAYHLTRSNCMCAAAFQLVIAAVQLSKAALSLLDLQEHTATHPRLGVVDHITCNPLGSEAQLSSATEAALSIGTPFTQQLLSNLLHSSFQKPVGRT
jgi:hypothetical protein